MKRLVWLAILPAAVAVALSQTAARGGSVSGTRPVPPGLHPAVVRVISPERGGMSLGSGTLIAVHGDHGLVITNWHVICDAAGQVQVVFPDGFRTPATVIKADREWDLAALAIWRPAVQPVPIAAQPPRPGEPLTIAGYGSGRYRAASGWCTQYVSPGRGQPFEMVELSVAARQGDSGGPIFNGRGELAGVLFGSGFGSTAGSYCGRVQRFVASVQGDFQRLQPNPYMLAGRAPQASQPAQPAEPEPESAAWQPPPAYFAVTQSAGEAPTTAAQPVPVNPPVAAIAMRPPAATNPPEERGHPADAIGWAAAAPDATATGAAQAPQPVAGAAAQAPMADYPGSTLGERLKTLLAAVGALAILFHSLRLLAVSR
ncbi:MAG: trypsin-like peptidase domain-containing protein [Pirellulales bacterium]|nr:trypsin-like peptidase domain-containing protein [Pirellulales bacterium]